MPEDHSLGQLQLEIIGGDDFGVVEGMGDLLELDKHMTEELFCLCVVPILFISQHYKHTHDILVLHESK
jgi:hypothetical protein